MHILTVDKAGNKTETVEGPITVTKPQAKVGEKVTKENKEYTKNGTAIIPVGFAIKPGCDDIANGLVISDVENDVNDTGNQFVWIPVPDINNYERDLSYPVTAKLYGNYDRYYDGSDYLPIGVTSERNEIESSKGFYIARYETGAGVVSKKGAWPVGEADSAIAKSGSKSFIDTRYVKSALISGIQWDYTMSIIDGKKDAGGQVFNVRSSLSQRHAGSIRTSGSNRSDCVFNIYDLEGNMIERTSKIVIGGSERRDC